MRRTKKHKETPEEAQARIAEEDARAAARRQRDEEEKQRRREECLKWANDQRQIALALAQQKAEEGVSEARASVLNQIGKEWLSCQGQLENWVPGLLHNPVHAFEWSCQQMEIAHYRVMLDRIINLIKGQPMALEDSLRWLKDYCERRLLDNCDGPGSTSGLTHRAMAVVGKEIEAKFRHTLIGWLEELDYRIT